MTTTASATHPTGLASLGTSGGMGTTMKKNTATSGTTTVTPGAKCAMKETAPPHANTGTAAGSTAANGTSAMTAGITAITATMATSAKIHASTTKMILSAMCSAAAACPGMNSMACKTAKNTTLAASGKMKTARPTTAMAPTHATIFMDATTAKNLAPSNMTAMITTVATITAIPCTVAIKSGMARSATTRAPASTIMKTITMTTSVT